MRQLRFAKRSRRAITACIACSARRGIPTPRAGVFLPDAAPASRQYWQLAASTMVCRIKSPFNVINNPVSSGSQLACHCRSRLPVRLLPVAPQFAPVAVRWSLWHCLTEIGTRQRLSGLRQHIANQRPPRVCAHSATFLPSSALMRPEPPRRAFVARRTSRAVFHFPTRRFTQPRFVVLPPVAQPLFHISPVSSISPYSGSANGQLNGLRPHEAYRERGRW